MPKPDRVIVRLFGEKKLSCTQATDISQGGGRTNFMWLKHRGLLVRVSARSDPGHSTAKSGRGPVKERASGNGERDGSWFDANRSLVCWRSTRRCLAWEG
ncbi:hypothetical protein CIHG_03777 [Coccidioides immitis H538.4]|uniref:Uncharacterized protein n=1 Tax=Coccidioides immitis H538.4 TaxID=396776 RepID=A0A0J8RLP4_COCIT|nr:hypothetical protein CIHG_03777 [Coccidioides immitis H538.4]